MELFFEIVSINQASFPDLTTTLYKYTTPFEQRVKDYQTIIDQYPDYVPMIIERHPNAKLDPFKKRKLVIQGKMDILKLQSVIRNHIKLKENETISIFVHDGYMERLKLLNLGNNYCPSPLEKKFFDEKNKNLAQIFPFKHDVFDKYKADDGFLYMTYTEFSSFG